MNFFYILLIYSFAMYGMNEYQNIGFPFDSEDFKEETMLIDQLSPENTSDKKLISGYCDKIITNFFFGQTTEQWIAFSQDNIFQNQNIIKKALSTKLQNLIVKYHRNIDIDPFLSRESNIQHTFQSKCKEFNCKRYLGEHAIEGINKNDTLIEIYFLNDPFKESTRKINDQEELSQDDFFFINVNDNNRQVNKKKSKQITHNIQLDTQNVSEIINYTELIYKLFRNSSFEEKPHFFKKENISYAIFYTVISKTKKNYVHLIQLIDEENFKTIYEYAYDKNRYNVFIQEDGNYFIRIKLQDNNLEVFPIIYPNAKPLRTTKENLKLMPFYTLLKLFENNKETIHQNMNQNKISSSSNTIQNISDIIGSPSIELGCSPSDSLLFSQKKDIGENNVNTNDSIEDSFESIDED